MSNNNIYRLIRSYNQSGLSGLPSPGYQVYSASYKLKIVLDLLLKHKQMARSTFYYYLLKSKMPDKHTHLRADITDVFHKHEGRYGYRRITLDLRNRGIMVNHKTVEGIMRQCNIKSIVRPKRYSSYKGYEGRTAPNIIQQTLLLNIRT